MYDKLWSAPLTTEVAQAVADHLRAGSSVHEVGAGTGLVSQHIQHVAGRFSASEPHPAMARTLRRRVGDQRVVNSAIDALSIEPVDHLVASNVLHLTDCPSDNLDRLAQFCTPQGSIIIVAPFRSPGVLAVTRAHRLAGADLWFRIRFVMFHLALTPLIVLDSRSEVLLDLGEPHEVIRSVSAIYVLKTDMPRECCAL